MTEKNKKNGLSQEDADLWKRVTKTLDKNNQSKNKSSSTTKKNQSINADLNTPNTNRENNNDISPDDWHEYIDQTTATPSDKIKINPESANSQSEPSQQTTKASRKKSREIPKPKTEDFAALLDSYEKGTPLKDNHAHDQSADQPKQPPGKSTTSQPPTPKPAVETFNQRDARNISSGKQTIDGAIDLHGLTQREAETALKNFLLRAQQDDKRTVLVITGKGRKKDYADTPFELGAPEPGVLRRSVPLWLDAMPNVILSYTTSHIKHGGSGALYVRLRRLNK